MVHSCPQCAKTFGKKAWLARHMASHERKRAAQPDIDPPPLKKKRQTSPPKSDDTTINEVHAGLSNQFKIYRIAYSGLINDMTVLSSQLKPHAVFVIDRAVGENSAVKAQFRCTVKFQKALDSLRTTQAYFNSKQAVYLHTTDTEAQYAMAMAEINKKIDAFTQSGSGWVVERILNCDLYISRYKPLRGNTYSKLPKYLEAKKAIINIANKDNKCFMWSVLAGLYPVEDHAYRVAKYRQHANKLDFTGISFPVTVDDIPKFESQNNLGINVLGYGDDGLFPIYPTPTRGIKVINLLLLEPEGQPAHYCLIKNLDRLMFRSTKYEGKKFICQYCLCPYNTRARLDKHQEYCTVDRQRVDMPEDPMLRFRNYHRQLRAPFAMYADFECHTKRVDQNRHQHIPNSYGLIGVERCCGEAQYQKPEIYRGPDPVKHFLESVINHGEAFVKRQKKSMVITPEQQLTFDEAGTCYLCNKGLADSKDRDHCHNCGLYRGAAHPSCNKTCRKSRDVTVFFHNLRRYDGHLIMQQIGSILQEKGLKLECVAKGMEDYVSFSVRLKSDGVSWQLRFVDSMAFLNASLEKLVKSLKKDQFRAMNRFMQHVDLLLRKGVYPYDYVDDPARFEETSLPPELGFYNRLSKSSISKADYSHAWNVWNTLGLRTFGEYHDLYLLTDVLLLCDVFENFRDFTLDNYGLDPAHYITLPSLSWDALLKHTGVELELLTNPDMYHFFTAGIRGGISCIMERHAKANNPYLPDYDQDKPNSYIMYLDANNLYGWAMAQKLPVGEFSWVGELDELPDDGYGYVLEVDLEYPAELHDRHNSYPLAPERMAPPYLSSYCEVLRDQLNLPQTNDEKLIPNLMDKQHYIIHHDSLKQCLQLGMKLKKIHRGIRFKEVAWMAPYIQFNTQKRTLATDSFHKDLFKLLNNAVFGKSMENVFNYTTVKLTADSKQYEKLVASSLYRETRHFNNDLHAVLMAKETAKLNRPIYTGFSVLELSKTLMYEFHYSYMLPKYGSAATLLFTDTDSLCYHVQTNDIYEDMLPDRDRWFDTSDYPTSNSLYSLKNKKVVGLMKDETNGVPISEFVGLRSKMYSIKCGDEEKKRAKGISRVVVKDEITHADYLTALQSKQQQHHSMTHFKAHEHQIYTTEYTKASLSPYDDKRYVLGDGVKTLAYGHKNIKVI